MNLKTTSRRAALGMTALGMLMAGLGGAATAAPSGAMADRPASAPEVPENNSMAISPDHTTAVVTKSDAKELVVIDLTDPDAPTRKIGHYLEPRNILFTPDGQDVIVSDSARGVIERLPLDGTEPTETWEVGEGAFGTAMSKDGDTLYVNNYIEHTVTTLDLETGDTGHVFTGFSEPRQGIELSPAEDELYVTNYDGDRITEVNLQDGAQRQLDMPGQFDQVRGIALNHDASRLYVANSGNNTVSIVDTEDGTSVNTVDVGDRAEPYGVALSGNEKTLLTGNKTGNSLTVISPSADQNAVRGTIDGVLAPRQAISFKDDRFAWALQMDLTVVEVDTEDMTITDTFGTK